MLWTKKSSFTVLLLAFGLWASSALASSDDVIARVGDTEITRVDLDNARRDIGRQFEGMPVEKRDAALLDALIDIVAISKIADAGGLGKDEAFLSRMALLKRRVMHNIYVSENVSKKITDDEIKARFDQETGKVEQVRASHILLETEEEAQAVIKLLDEGGDFAAIAKEKSTGPSGPKGGDLGFFGKGQMVPEFETAVFALKAGKYTSEPVKTQFGYHVIKAVERRKAPSPDYTKVKEQYRQLILRERYAELVEKTRTDQKIEILDESLKLAKKSGQ